MWKVTTTSITAPTKPTVVTQKKLYTNTYTNIDSRVTRTHTETQVRTKSDSNFGA